MDVLLGRRYRTVEVIGSGGAATVYRAVDENLGREVAVKLFHPSVSDDDENRRQRHLPGHGTRGRPRPAPHLDVRGADLADALDYVHSNGVIRAPTSIPWAWSSWSA